MITGTIKFEPVYQTYRCEVRTPKVIASCVGQDRAEAMCKALEALKLPVK